MEQGTLLGLTPAVMLWLGLAVFLGITEIFTAGFFCMFFAAGAFLAAVVAWFVPDDFSLQIITFFVGALVNLALLRPVLKKMLKVSDKPMQDSNVDALINQPVLVLETVEKFKGKVKIVHTGEVWSAYLTEDSATGQLPEGQEGIIVRVDGAKLAIQPKG